MKLVIVESPAKAKTIQKFLGAPYKVVASYGHIRDLPSAASEVPKRCKDKPWARLAVDVDNDFAPVYVVSKDSMERVAALKKMVKDADEVILATDEDREGESISWHLLEELKPDVPVRRIAFHEITKSAIDEAIAHPRDVDEQLVRAQESRRILDRLYGYTLSPVLWKKIRTKLSAGRVQSVATRLIVEREEERQAFHSAEYWDVEASFEGQGREFAATLTSIGGARLATGKDFDADTGELKHGSEALWLQATAADGVAEAEARTAPWRVANVEKKETKQRPAPPFITSTLQQAASGRLGMTPRQTMVVAQRLYEGVDLGSGDREGLITYMRTDSTMLSQKALGDCESVIRDLFGDEYHKRRQYQTKSKSAQEAHEAIRPTDVARTPEEVAGYLDHDESRLYRLIWNRAVASQMADAILDKTAVDIVAPVEGGDHVFRANGSVVKFPGFLRVHGGAQKDALLPDLKEGQEIGSTADGAPTEARREVNVVGLAPQRHETQPPPRYTEASLIRKLEEEGIGRPSTYAPIISTIQQRDYVAKKSGGLVPTYIGMAVVVLLRNHFPQYVDLKFTAQMEERLDNIAEGSADWIEFLSDFYRGQAGQNGLLRQIEQEMPKIDIPVIPIGDDPETGKPISVRIGQRSVYVQRGEGGKGDSATVPKELLIDELTPAKAHEMIDKRVKSSEPIGQHPETGENVYAIEGPYGPYAQLGEGSKTKKPKRVSLPKGMSVEDADLDYALKLLSLPREVGVDPETGKRVTAGIGRYGPYVERDGQYGNLDSVDEVFAIDLAGAIERLAQKKKGRTKTVLKELGAHPQSGETVQVMEGRYGPYVTDGKVNATLPKNSDPSSVEMDQAVELLAKAAARPKKTRRKRAPAKKRAKKK